ncbi:GntR family transcriptional regulator [Priestia endophytica]|uniref:GntR family transcriptional regulator n=1 Tax=Priestia endophytica TaxID=135735 RepID=UPI00227F2B8A|nr:GntR family transcriptional regulator [Priestia endophytica]MCY8232671.1 GntR family transcriptional regulator [Priestia endophytica]
MLEIMPNLDSTKKEPLYLQLYEYLRKEIQKGNIPPHSKLPSQRNLANHLSLSRNTINTAYQQLVTEGYVRNEERKGLFVEEIKNEMLLTEPYSPGVRETTNNELNAHEGKSIKIKYDFKYGDIDLTHFPFKLWRQLTLKSLAHEQDHLLLYGHPQGGATRS